MLIEVFLWLEYEVLMLGCKGMLAALVLARIYSTPREGMLGNKNTTACHRHRNQS